jgi:Ca2+-binding RTX toxin-like protein
VVLTSIAIATGALRGSRTLEGNMANITGTSGNDNLVGTALNDTINGLLGADTMAGGKGNDTYYFGAGDWITELDNEGFDTVVTSVDYGAHTNVEKVVLEVGAGDLWISGNIGKNTLIGNEGNNELDGLSNADLMQGGKGNDTYFVDNIGDKVVELANEGTDEVHSKINFSLAALTNIENLALYEEALKATGNALGNRIDGNANDNVIDGGTGKDTMTGGYGNDTYYVDNVNDAVEELSNEGTDTVISKVALTNAFDNVENYDFSKLLGGVAFVGNSLYNTIKGGAGIDTLSGGAGGDHYYLNSSQDVVIENVAEGDDEIVTNFSADLNNYANIEGIRLIGTANLNAYGNDLGNEVGGNDGANIIDGRGGADDMNGGKGNDTYYVDHALDYITEYGGSGVDTVISEVTYTLNDGLEHLTLTKSALNGTGNSSNNRIVGNELGNTLDGKVGADTLKGGVGDDTYIVDNVGDKVIENAGEGTDHVKSMISYSLAALGNVENLTLLGMAFSGTGNALNNSLFGNEFDNLLDGGAGADVMLGGKGNDTYYMDTGFDKISEGFEGGNDTVVSSVAFQSVIGDVENYDFSKLAGGVTFTGDANDNIIKGGAGVDTLTGLLGNDTYYVNSAQDKVVEAAFGGSDSVVTGAFSIDLSKYANIENATLLGTAALNLKGTTGVVNVLKGNAGANVLDGLGGFGVNGDILIGGKGNDKYYVHAVQDQVVEGLNEGIDTAFAAIQTYTLKDNCENLVLLDGAINGNGNELKNKITGNAAANVLDGLGGADTMTGGAGNDAYRVDSLGDKVIELSGQGRDLVFVTVDNYILGANVEDLYMAGGAIKGTGNALANDIVGTGADNILDGKAGADTMKGGLGDDKYYVDNLGDLIVEEAGWGTDTVYSRVALSNAFDNIENYDFRKAASAVNFTGNDLQNDIWSSAYADTLAGGKGDDCYYLNNVGDKVVELSGEGSDYIQSRVSVTKLAENVEDVCLEWGVATALKATGNDLDNQIDGNQYNNVLNGGVGNDRIDGSLGNDTLSGGNGADAFIFYNAGSGGTLSGHDVITDFDRNNDELWFVYAGDSDKDGISGELEDSVGGITDYGVGKDVVVQLLSGASITFKGIGTGSIDQITDLVADPSTQLFHN